MMGVKVIRGNIPMRFGTSGIRDIAALNNDSDCGIDWLIRAISPQSTYRLSLLNTSSIVGIVIKQ